MKSNMAATILAFEPDEIEMAAMLWRPYWIFIKTSNTKNVCIYIIDQHVKFRGNIPQFKCCPFHHPIITNRANWITTSKKMARNIFWFVRPYGFQKCIVLDFSVFILKEYVRTLTSMATSHSEQFFCALWWIAFWALHGLVHTVLTGGTSFTNLPQVMFTVIWGNAQGIWPLR